MIRYATGNILESNAQALVNTVNTVGVMGKGIALQFKRAYPNNFAAYRDACKNNAIAIGKLFVTKDKNINSGEKVIINFPTKTDWRKSSEYQYIEAGLNDLVKIINDYDITSVALPPLGAGNGGLMWGVVKSMIENKLSGLNTDIVVYEPTAEIKEVLNKERVKLTDARALLLYVLYKLVSNGEYVSEFSSEKVCYFLQKFGASKYFRLKFEPKFYGPYSGKVRHVLNRLNGSYITGYSDMNTKPFEFISLVSDGHDTVNDYIVNSPELHEIAQRTVSFLDGFYSDYALELLSSVDYLMERYKTVDYEIIIQKLGEWTDRKRSLFSNQEHIEIAIEHIRKANDKLLLCAAR